jgi:peptidoglycan hydrolase-like protein with peptidoglycan-binding domain
MTRKTLALLACTLIAPAVAAAQTGGLTKIQLYALQQQLKIECGLHYATGTYDPETRAAVRTCNQKYGTTGNGAALLAAMNVGFSAGDSPPTSVSDVPRGMGTPAYNVTGSGTMTTTTTTTETMTMPAMTAADSARARRAARARARRDSIARARGDTIHH